MKTGYAFLFRLLLLTWTALVIFDLVNGFANIVIVLCLRSTAISIQPIALAADCRDHSRI
jgi:hypothetical protein